jgi:hypothetical protein
MAAVYLFPIPHGDPPYCAAALGHLPPGCAMTALRFTDAQIEAIGRAAAPIRQPNRGAFLPESGRGVDCGERLKSAAPTLAAGVQPTRHAVS